MAYINTSRRISVSIGGRSYSRNIISGTITDDSSLATSILKTSGTIILGGNHGDSHVDFFGNRFSVGDSVNIGVSTGSVVSSEGVTFNIGALHPRGRLYVISSSTDLQQQQTNVEVGCKLQLYSTYENLFVDEVFKLFNLVEDSLRYFVVPDYSLATLDSILQTLGKAIFQSSGGGIQIIDVPVGVGQSGGGGGFTSYDTETAIEIGTFADAAASNDPLSLSITMSYDIPKNPKEEEPDTPPEDEKDADDDDPVEPPDPDSPQDEVIKDVSYVKSKKLKLKSFRECLKIYKGKKTIIDYDDARALRSCGKYLNPKYIVTDEEIENWVEGDACQEPLEPDAFITVEQPYSYAVEGSLDLEEEVYFSDYVETFNVTSYTGPGNQADAEWSWESQSLWVLGDQIISQWYDFMRTEFQNAASEANSWMEQANQYFELRDENNIYGLSEQDVECMSLDELIKMRRDYFFYDCSGVNALINADSLIYYCGEVYNEVLRRFNTIDGRRSLNNFSIRKTEFGPGGEVVKRISTQIVHRATSHLAKEHIDKFAKVFDEQEPDFFDPVIDRTKALPSYGRYKWEPLFTDPEIRLYDIINIPPVTKSVTGGGQGSARTVTIYKNGDYEDEPQDNGDVSINLVATSRTIEEYVYLTTNGTPLIRETVENIDYANKNNGSTQVKLSTDFSSAPTAETANANAVEAINEEDEKEDENGLDPNDDNPCGIDTEQREVIYRVSRGGPSPSSGSDLSGKLSLYDEPISLPIQLRPLVPQRLDIGQVLTEEDCSALLASSIQEATTRLAEYEKIITKYLTFEMSKRLGDNRGFRVTESMRPEVYNYHPYMNVSMVSKVNGFSCSGMVSSANWAFDQSNALCSFDCFVFGYNQGVPFGSATKVSVQKPITIPPGSYEVLTTEILEVTDSAYTIKLQKIENPYYKYYLDDVELDESPTVAVIDIVNGRLRLYNFTPEEPEEPSPEEPEEPAP